MDVALRGNSPSTVTAGIMLLTRARQLGYPLKVTILGDESTLTPVPGPAVVYAPVLASCGVGRDHGQGATVVVPGPPGEPLMVTVDPHGVGSWFLIDRFGEGRHPATQAYVLLATAQHPEARDLAQRFRDVLGHLGMPNEPAILDVLFGAPVPPLLRVALALRAGRAMSGGRGESITRFLTGLPIAVRDPVDLEEVSSDQIITDLEQGRLEWILHRFSPAVRDEVAKWCEDATHLLRTHPELDASFLVALIEIASHLAQLPAHSILPPLGAAEDSVAVGLKAALTADGDGDASRQLCQVYRFLGGRFTDHAPHAYDVSHTPPPENTSDHALAWRWFCSEVRIGRKRADHIFEQIFHPAE